MSENNVGPRQDVIQSRVDTESSQIKAFVDQAIADINVAYQPMETFIARTRTSQSEGANVRSADETFGHFEKVLGKDNVENSDSGDVVRDMSDTLGEYIVTIANLYGAVETNVDRIVKSTLSEASKDEAFAQVRKHLSSLSLGEKKRQILFAFDSNVEVRQHLEKYSQL